MKIHSVLAACFLALLMGACTSKGEPSPVGEVMTAEQMAALPQDASLNQKLVAVDGYWDFGSMMIKAGQKNRIEITTEPNGEGQELITAMIGVRSGEKNSTQLGGEASRNYITTSTPLEAKNCKVMTDDYKEVGYQKMCFSGTLIFENDAYHLENVTFTAL